MQRKSRCELNFFKFVTRTRTCGFAALLFGLHAASASATPLPTVEQRLAAPQLKTAIMGALLHLDDTQIRPRFGIGDPRYYACAFGCLPQAPGTGQALPLPLPPVDNRPGEWANFINLLPKDLSSDGQGADSLLQIQDTNLFMTAAIAYPLYLIDESALPPDEQIASQLRQAAGTNIQSYRRGPAFAFWPQQNGSSSLQPRVGPLNIPMVLGNLQLIGQLFPGDARHPRPNPQHDEWNKDVFDSQINPTGVDALGNIPNDADDTALALAAMHFGMQYDRQTIPDEEPVLEMLRWRDQARVFEDGRDQWKGKSSGAILTWFKDEGLPREQRFRTPESGVIPNAVNNVDCVVNANALLALGLSGHGSDAAVPAITAVLAKAVAHLSWPECGLYYPQKMIFPYALSRAYREGGITDPALKQAVLQILPQIILEQQKVALRSPLLLGAFSGGADPSFDLATALGLASLLNIGEANAQEAG